MGNNIHSIIYGKQYSINSVEQWMSTVHGEKLLLPIDGVDDVKAGGINHLPIQDLMNQGLRPPEGELLAQYRDGSLAKFGLVPGGKANMAPHCIHGGGRHTVRPVSHRACERRPQHGSGLGLD